MKYNIEYAVCEAVKAYLESTLDPVDFASWPVVTWFDPMAQDPGNRVAVICQSAKSDSVSPGNFECEVEIGVRTDWAQPTVQSDMAAHFDRVAQVRDVLNDDAAEMGENMAAFCPAGFTITYIDQSRAYSTEVNEGSYFSNATITVNAHAVEE